MEKTIEKKSAIKRIANCLINAHPPALKSLKWLFKWMIPVSFMVTMLQYIGVVEVIANFIQPVFEYAGVSGQGALVFITASLLNIYSAIAVIGTLTLNMHEITILALMCLISHNLIIETIVQKKTGSKAWRMVSLRIVTAFVSAFILNWLLPDNLKNQIYEGTVIQKEMLFFDVLSNWFYKIVVLLLKIIVFVYSLMFLQKLLEEFGILNWLSKILKPLMFVLGLPAKTSFLWVVANVIGLMYGATVMFDELEKGKLSNTETDMLNHHTAISHSLLEDTLLFAAIGVPVLWITFPRLILAIPVVWAYKIFMAKQKAVGVLN